MTFEPDTMQHRLWLSQFGLEYLCENVKVGDLDNEPAFVMVEMLVTAPTHEQVGGIRIRFGTPTRDSLSTDELDYLKVDIGDVVLRARTMHEGRRRVIVDNR